MKSLENLRKKFPKTRLIVRPSGTEPLVRIMTEGDSPSKIEELAVRAEELTTFFAEKLA